MQEMLSDRKTINLTGGAGRLRQMKAIRFGVKGSLRQSDVSIFKRGNDRR